ncbi:HEAT repeat domain-containing protein [Actinomadura harenae]|nr:HEAT repeat domain-containing protein [Actinomadura harenae]
MDEIETIIMTDPEGSRATVLASQGDERLRLRALGEVGDPADFGLITAALGDPALRCAALEALAGQPDADGADALARSYLDDPTPDVRSRAAGLVAFHGRPNAVEALLPLTRDPVAHVRMKLAWDLGALGGPAVEAALHRLLDDPDEMVRKSAARGLTRKVRHLPHADIRAGH